MIGQGGVATDDFANNEEDIAVDWENNDDHEELMQKVPTRYTYHALSSLVLIQ
jgi:hypothetical protein